MLEIITSRTTVPVVVDAGIGVPSHAARLEMALMRCWLTGDCRGGRSGDDGNRFRPAVEAGLLARQQCR